MALPEDPKGYRRGQPGHSHDPAGERRSGEQRQPAPRAAARQPAPRQDDHFPSLGAGAPGGDFQERPQAGRAPQQPSFSAYRPEAYANEKRANGRAPERQQDWQAEPQFRSAEPAPAPRAVPQDAFAPAPAAPRGRAAHHDPYGAASNDPYGAGSDFDSDWRSTDYQEPAPTQYASSDFYRDEPPAAGPDAAQSMHDRFFSAEPEPERAPPAPQPRAAAPAPQRFQQNDFAANDFSANDFEHDDFEEEPRPAPRAAKQPAPAPAPARGGAGDFEEAGGDYRWDNFDQAPPVQDNVRPFQAKVPAVRDAHARDAHAHGGHDEDLDADYFADEEEFDGEDEFVEPKSGGSKKLMAAVLVGAVVTGGGLAYLYKSQSGPIDGGEPPIMTADTRPIKETPADPGGREFPNGDKLIYDRLPGGAAGGGDAAAGEEPTRVAANEEQTSGSGGPGVVTTGGGTLEERIQSALREAKRQEEPAQTASANTASSFDSPRIVRTETFRPDGSVDNSRPQRRQAAAAPAPQETETALAAAPTTRGSAGRDFGGAPQISSSPPVSAPAAAAPARQQVAAANPAATITSGGEPGMFVQIAARNDQAAAMAAFADLKQKYATVLGDHSPSVRKVDLGEKGVWFRLLVGPMSSKADADRLCEDLKAAGMKGCFSRKE